MMKSHLLALSVGPVQDFISAARRTRDLWFGSHMLSEIAKAAARAVDQAGGHLIFPDPPTRKDLDDIEFTVANIILAETDDPRSIAEKAEKAARERWLDFAQEAREKVGSMIRIKAWEEQLDDVVDFYCAWTPAAQEQYKATLQRVMALLAARKNCRSFFPFMGKEGLSKSSLDGLRETVLEEGARSHGPFRIKPGESLCAVGVTKRVSGEGRFPSVSRVAADPWLRGLLRSEEGRGILQVIKCRCQNLLNEGALSSIRVKNGLFDEFPYEGTPLFLDRHDSIEKEAPPKSEIREDLLEIQKALERCAGSLGAPASYLAVLCADGDRMGKVISEAASSDEHREISSALSAFALDARKTIEEHRGVCVYTGGDDVLAFLPCDTALDCARALHDGFERRLDPVLTKGGNRTRATLSIGVAVGHALEDLADLLEWGREAGRRAKADGEPSERDGLAVVVRARRGSDQYIRERWAPLGGEGEERSLDQRLIFWAEIYGKRALPYKFGYEVRTMADFYKGWADRESCAMALKMDLNRVFARKDVSLTDEEKREVETSLLSKINSVEDLERFADELIIGQWFSESMEQAKGGRPRASDGNAS